MDPDRARELLTAERARIERALARLGHQDTGEPADEEDPANLASDLYQDELDEGLSDDLREELAAVERAEARLAAGTYGLSVEVARVVLTARLLEGAHERALELSASGPDPGALPLSPARLFFGGPLGRGKGFEALVRDRAPAHRPRSTQCLPLGIGGHLCDRDA